jgi:hypothetical protein
LGENFENWRFSILINNKELLLKKIFQEEGLFASSHYAAIDYKYLDNPIQDSNSHQIAGKIVNETGASATQSFNLVEKDVRYTTLRKKAFSIKKYAKTLDNKADYYNKIFQALSQSISNLRTERNRTT